MTAGRIVADRDGAVARLTIDHVARRNAMTFDMWKELANNCRQIASDSGVRAVVLTGAGDQAFCAGADISQFGDMRSSEGAVGAYDDAVAEASRALASLEKPTVALVEGVCFGGGMGLAMACDVRLAASTAQFRIPAARLGLGYPFESLRSLVHKLGPAAVADIFFSARILGADEAQSLGIVQAVWPVDTFRRSADDYVRQVASNAPLTLAAVKRALIELGNPPGETDVAAVDDMVKACFASADYREGQIAFKEKREPRFKGV